MVKNLLMGQMKMKIILKSSKKYLVDTQILSGHLKWDLNQEMEIHFCFH